VTSARDRLFGKVSFLIAFRSPADLKADLAGKPKCKSLAIHTLASSKRWQFRWFWLRVLSDAAEVGVYENRF
jgi:hypothetical protein